MNSPKNSNNTRKNGVKKTGGTAADQKQSEKSSVNSLSLEKQVEMLKDKTGTLFEQMATDENVSFEQFYGGYARAKAAFRIMENVMQLSERMKQLKDGV